MRPLTTFILLIIVLAVGGYVLYLNKSQDQVVRREGDPLLLPGFEFSTVHEIHLTNPAGAFRFQRSLGSSFRVREPIDAPADSGSLAGVAAVFEFVEIVRELGVDLPEYGLEDPRISVRVQASDPLSAFELEVGSEDALQKNVWIRVTNSQGSDGIYVVPKEIVNPLSFGLDDFRERRMYALRAWDVVGLTITGNDHEIRATRHGNAWLLEKPEPGRGDLNKIRELLNAVLNSRAEAFAAADIDLFACGLEPPRLELSIDHSVGAGGREVLRLGSVDSAGRVHARKGTDGTVVLLKGELLNWVRIDPDELRDSRVFPATGLDVIAVVVDGREDSSPFSLERDPEDEGVWWVVEGERRRTADNESAMRAARLVNDLRATRVKRAASQDLVVLGLDPMSARVRFRVSDRTELLELRIGLPVEDKDEVAVRNGTEAAVYFVPPEAIESLLAPSYRFRDRQVISIAKDEVVSFSLKLAGRHGRFSLGGDDLDRQWTGSLQSEEDGDSVEINYTEVQLFLDKCTDLVADELVDGGEGTDLSTYRLADPELILSLTYQEVIEDGRGPSMTRTVHFAKSRDGGALTVLAYDPDEQLVFRLTRNLFGATKSFLDRVFTATEPSEAPSSVPR